MKSTLVEKAGASDAPRTAQTPLQQILGTDKRNPVFSLFRDPTRQTIHVYYGLELLEVVPEHKEHLAFRCLIGRLYNAGVKAKSLQQQFGVDRKTMQRWGQALQADDPQQLLKALAGRGAPRKLTPEIRSFVAVRFASIYPQNRRSYSRAIREEIRRIFGIPLSSEALRPLFQQLKAQLQHEMAETSPTPAPEEKRATACDLGTALPAQQQGSPAVQSSAGTDCEEGEPVASSPKQSPVLSEPKTIRLCHHLGILLFSGILNRIEQAFARGGKLFQQWLATLWLGAVNIEQSKLLDFDDLKELIGSTTRSLFTQRGELTKLAANAQTVPELLAFNAQELKLESERDFYFDPHTKHYTGLQKILKGWCARIRFADKVLHTDFIHSADGSPVFLGWTDNYEDLRQRFFALAQAFRTQVGLGLEAVLTLVADRGIFSHRVFERILEAANYHLITWEKNYRRGQWDTAQKAGTFVLERARNHAEDKRSYHFEYMDRDWASDPKMRQLVVRATNPKGKTVELGVLSDDRNRAAPEILTLIFSRWIQENDFKYLDKHFGINEITSYASVAYQELQSQLEDKQVQSGADKALQEQQRQIQRQLSALLLQEHRHPKKSAKRTARITELTDDLTQVEEKRAAVQKEVSRLEHLIEHQMVRLDTKNKSVMDSLKVIARNAFYQALRPFKKSYNNYRDDHELFRNLTQSDGILVESARQVDVHLLPTVNYSPKLRNLIAQILDQMNAAGPQMPDGSKRRLGLHLAKKEGIQLAISVS